ncbi:hypothetical protein Airi01_085580 [Actinoallomurus iriomotensis]|uniref:Uncharacterized protein n=1 Tax=Actinoallomurus iriomotensis TaxID=478107 RepID=A0A9W6RPX3_9ACTN|nr:hypothetical protein Airi01_085580 [Actinoallomurus iriomotensis]
MPARDEQVSFVVEGTTAYGTLHVPGGAAPTAFLTLGLVIRLAPGLFGSFWVSSTVILVPLPVVLARRHRGRAG